MKYTNSNDIANRKCCGDLVSKIIISLYSVYNLIYTSLYFVYQECLSVVSGGEYRNMQRCLEASRNHLTIDKTYESIWEGEYTKTLGSKEFTKLFGNPEHPI